MENNSNNEEILNIEEIKNSIINLSSDKINIVFDDNTFNIKVSNLEEEKLLDFLNNLFDLENKTEKYYGQEDDRRKEENKEKVKDEERIKFILSLRGLNLELLISAIKYSLEYENMPDPVMLLNIINLIKTYNSLDDSYFNNENVYFNSIIDVLDLKSEIEDELNKFIKKLSFYFISIIKSCNRFVITPLDKHEKLPVIYRKIILSLDFVTLSGIFSISDPINTDDCIIIDDAYLYLVYMMDKFANSNALISNFLEDMEKENKKVMTSGDD